MPTDQVPRGQGKRKSIEAFRSKLYRMLGAIFFEALFLGFAFFMLAAIPTAR